MWFASRVLDVQTRFRDVVADPGGDFRSKTGLSFPTSAKIIWVGDDHGGFHGDGEVPLVRESSRPVFEQRLLQSPPWDKREWMTGPGSQEIGIHCGLAVAIRPRGGGKGHLATDRSNDVRAFRDFLDERLSHGAADLTLDEAWASGRSRPSTGDEVRGDPPVPQRST